MRHRSRKQAPKRSHAYERHCVKTHHASAFVLFDNCLDDCVASRHLLHHPEAAEQHRQER